MATAAGAYKCTWLRLWGGLGGWILFGGIAAFIKEQHLIWRQSQAP
ncbi:MAG: hypothetical protein JF885_06405 [Candidatus Dormibacteraeota bacterium]|nr:hypothetical protein [Candidatus Dormibacteraeota bacterium]